MKPNMILVFSGKRKSGKDFVTDRIQKEIGENSCIILRLSSPLKLHYAIEHNLDYEHLLDASSYKEKYRFDMIKWGEEKREKDPGYFCNIICEESNTDHPIWIISDARRKTDVQYFKKKFGERVMTVRVTASDHIRKERGWNFKEGVDDAESECDLDSGVEFDYVIENNDLNELNNSLANLICKMQMYK